MVAFEARLKPAAWPVGARRPHVTRAAPPLLVVRDESHVVAFYELVPDNDVLRQFEIGVHLRRVECEFGSIHYRDNGFSQQDGEQSSSKLSQKDVRRGAEQSSDLMKP